MIDKDMDVIFCNPPYSEYQEWAEKAILEANTHIMYLVIPQRWKDSHVINLSLQRRGVEAKVIYSDDFLDAPRSARAKVDIIKIDFQEAYSDWRRTKGKGAFDIWFQDSFGTFDKVKEESEKKEIPFKERLGLVPGQNLIERMELLYSKELSKIRDTYDKVCSIDPELANEFNISIDTIKSGIKEKFSGLKHKYWKELFDNLTKITDRLTQKSRDNLLKTLQNNVEVDFSAANAYAIVLWAIKNANEYYDDQLIECYERLVNKESCLLYKSNSHFVDDTWRFATENSHYYLNDKLDYRIVTHRVGGYFSGDSWRTYDQRYNLSLHAYEYIQDLCTIAKNLGYDVNMIPLNFDWQAGNERVFLYDTNKVFMKVRAFKNGNIHFKFNQDFLRKFNVEFGRIKGWINNKSQASEEMNIPKEKIDEIYKSNYRIEVGQSKLLIS
ncbi:MAG: DUF4942 domain-containing protein [Spirochaetales bacterium]|nr:DUF4942 domain-containing protein [Spirochaetales bacterium]